MVNAEAGVTAVKTYPEIGGDLVASKLLHLVNPNQSYVVLQHFPRQSHKLAHESVRKTRTAVSDGDTRLPTRDFKIWWLPEIQSRRLFIIVEATSKRRFLVHTGCDLSCSWLCAAYASDIKTYDILPLCLDLGLRHNFY